MDHSYDLGLEARSEPKRAVSRSMRVVKQECNVGMPDGEKTLKPRKRALVACNRCRKRKIKCNGDLNNGLACSSCLSVGANECHYSRVNSLSPEEAARCIIVGKKGRSNPLSMGSPHSPQMRTPYQREEYGMEQSSFSRQSAGMDPLMAYDEQSVPYQSSYMLPSNVDYTWANRWDPALRPTGDLFEDSINQYNFIIPGQVPSTLPSSMPEQPSTVFPEVDRTLPTPRSQPEVSDQKAFYGRDRMPTAYNPRVKSDDAEMVFGYIPMSTADDAVPVPTTVSSNYDPEMEFNADRLTRTYSRDTAQRLLPLDAYGYSSGRKTERAPTLMNGLPYTRVRPSDPVQYSFLPDALPEYGREVHRSAVSPLGHPGY
ncbi:unnamed protein product [Penicillium salamii]|uniref:Zn(2)-C6 fungal-type domain-containing protein n=1 Tax=Penicillium salamii TaxID=1612424 RepID=A0A9W4J784_9EURO|nr:unnamed protein product [Penicillium salamii]CAG8375239.1 unnamed protein product [Penicillium salamii]CAG8375730.1 unnamed protein product [Penicillium salamii]CAG8415790.1 unnamed protein product [Penicillium salamii]